MILAKPHAELMSWVDSTGNQTHSIVGGGGRNLGQNDYLERPVEAQKNKWQKKGIFSHLFTQYN